MKRIALIFVIISLMFSGNLFAHKITVPVCGLVTVPPTPIPMEIEWNEKWFGERPSTVYHHGIARIAALLATNSYVDVENEKDNELLQAYKLLGVSEKNMEFHYTLDYSNPVWGNDQCAFSIASKTIDSALGKRDLVFLVIRGTPLNANEWISNVNLSDKTGEESPIHEGFSHASQQIHSALYSYMLKHKIDAENSFILLTGHSRGAAVSNMLAAEFTYGDVIDTDKVYAYTFAAPNVTTYDIEKDPRYSFIWNIVSAEDIVPTVPMNRRNWKYKKYGNVLTIVNYWNTDSDRYENEYLPKMNELYKKLLLRDFCPFYLGPFLPIQITDIATSVNDTVQTYYRGFTGIRTKADKLFRKIFPPILYDTLTPEPVKDEEHDSSMSSILTYLNNKTDGLADYAMKAFVDMHAAESYLSWMMALDEGELFTVQPYAQLVIEGNFDCAVFDKEGQCVVKVENGHVSLGSLKYKIPARSIFPEGAVIGIPGNKEFDVYVSKDSVFPTKSRVKIEHFRADGVLESEGPFVTLKPKTGKLYHFKAGRQTQTEVTVSAKTIRGKKVKRITDKAGIKPRTEVMLRFEHALDINLNMDMGVQYGCQNIYGTLLVSQYLNKMGKMLGFDLGLGRQRNLHGFLNLDYDLSSKFRWTTVDTGKDDSTFNIVPSLRLLLSLKPVKRFHVFMAGVFDVEIDGFNNGAFSSKVRNHVIPSIPLGTKVRAAPIVQFGFKF